MLYITLVCTKAGTGRANAGWRTWFYILATFKYSKEIMMYDFHIRKKLRLSCEHNTAIFLQQ